jgi:hypothetical protein
MSEINEVNDESFGYLPWVVILVSTIVMLLVYIVANTF